MKIQGTLIEETYAEAFRMYCSRLVVTANDAHWASVAATSFAGYGTSIVGCDAEVGLEREVAAGRTPDSRPGAALLVFHPSLDKLAAAVADRAGQCLLTCPTTALYDGLPEARDRIRLGSHVRFFGDRLERRRTVGGRKYWRIPVMDGEFLIEDSAGVLRGVGGGNFIIQGCTPEDALRSASRAVAAVAACPGVITPFPGGIVRSGSKVGSRYSNLKASTNEPFCPTVRSRVPGSRLHPDAACVYEIVIDGLDTESVTAALRAGILAAVGPGVPVITAGNYGGRLGRLRFHLEEVLS